MQRLMSLAAAAALVFAVNCTEPTCTREIVPYVASVNASAISGPRVGLPVARFDVTQSFIQHRPIGCDGAPAQDIGTIDMTITSVAPVSQFFTYAVQGLNAQGTPIWAFEDTVHVIAPGQTVNVGRVAVSAARLEFGARVLLKDVFPLP